MASSTGSGLSIGMSANDELRQFFGHCKDGSVRILKILIEDEKLSLDGYCEAQGSWEDDFENFVPGLVEEQQPCYLLFRLDSKGSSGGYEWLMISWSPDDSPVRKKMLYASTKATLKKEFGGGQIKDEYHATVMPDVTLRGYKTHQKTVKEPAPLTAAEEELMEIKKQEVRADISVDSKHQTLSGVVFPLQPGARRKLAEFAQNLIDYVQLSIDLGREVIEDENLGDADLRSLPSKVPEKSARYHLFRFKHTHEGDYLETPVFIYSMPGYSCSIKERMLYSSCKAPLLQQIQSEFNIPVIKNLEVESGEELTEETLMDEVHPKRTIHRQQFAKPKGPATRGPRRITKPKT